jgi:hypothetical protein
MGDLFYVLIIIFMVGCGSSEEQKCYDKGVAITDEGERYVYFCKIDDDFSPIVHDGRMCKKEGEIYNELAEKCIIPICDQNEINCIQGCDAEIEGEIFRLFCSTN